MKSHSLDGADAAPRVAWALSVEVASDPLPCDQLPDLEHLLVGEASTLSLDYTDGKRW